MTRTIISLIATLIIGTWTAMASRPLFKWFNVKQPDGTVVTVRKEGNGQFAYYVSTDGIALLRDAADNLTYATKSGKTLVPSRIIARNSAERTSEESAEMTKTGIITTTQAYELLSATTTLHDTHSSRSAASTEDGMGEYGRTGRGILPSIGTPTIPVIMVSFADKDFQPATTAEKVSRLLNETGYADEKFCAGSVKDYFRAQSDGMFVPHFEIAAQVKLSKNYAYYGQNGTGSTIDINKYEFMRETLESAYQKGVDFEKYATGGCIPLITFFFAGPGEHSSFEENCEDYLWAHFSTYSFTVGGITIQSYFVGNELLQSYKESPDNPSIPIVTGANIDGIGVLCHELGHALGLPDFYYNGYNSTTRDTLNTMGYWSVMDYGNYAYDGYAPIGYNAYERSMMGWLPIKELTSAGHYSLQSFNNQADGAQAYCIRNPENEKEYYILENRQPDTWYPDRFGHGLLITHVDCDSKIWNTNKVNSDANRQRFSFVPADNSKENKDLSKDYPGDLFPGTTGNTEFTDNSIPSATVYSASGLLNRPIYGIKENDGVIYFAYLDKTLVGIPHIPPSHTPEATAIFSLDGRRMKSAKTLPNGLYIIKEGKGSKLIIK